jgi:hypothetical protein
MPKSVMPVLPDVTFGCKIWSASKRTDGSDKHDPHCLYGHTGLCRATARTTSRKSRNRRRRHSARPSSRPKAATDPTTGERGSTDTGPARVAAVNASHARSRGTLECAGPGRHCRRRLWPDSPGRRTRDPTSRLPERSRFAVAQVPRRCTSTSSHTGWRGRNWRYPHADGQRHGHGSHHRSSTLSYRAG